MLDLQARLLVEQITERYVPSAIRRLKNSNARAIVALYHAIPKGKEPAHFVLSVEYHRALHLIREAGFYAQIRTPDKVGLGLTVVIVAAKDSSLASGDLLGIEAYGTEIPSSQTVT